MKAVFRGLGRGLQLTLAGAIIGWIALALYFQQPSLQIIAYVALAVAALGLSYAAFTGRWGMVWAGMVALVAAASLWWTTIIPLQTRDWKAEVSRGVSADITDTAITVRNIRNFDWTSDTEAVEQWYDLTVDPDKITSLDMALSVWDSPDIAHTLVSFGFEDGHHIVFSGEIRKEKAEEFSTIGGFFRRYELVLIAADERDIIRLRTDMRGEQVSLYPIILTPKQRKDLFLAFLGYGNDLQETPRWYHTLTTNCTTMPYALVRKISDRVTLDRRIILSGRLPEYLYDLGVLPKDMTVADIRAKALLGPLGPAGDDGPAFSTAMRKRWQD